MKEGEGNWVRRFFPVHGMLEEKRDDRPECWAIRLDGSYDWEQVFQALSSEERRRAERFATQELVWNFAVAHWSLRMLLGRWMKCRPCDLCLTEGRFGKPRVSGGPFFNMSHTRNTALVAISASSEVGVDVEHVRDFPGRDEIAAFFSPQERLWINRGAGAWKRFFRCWVLREAFVKALGLGLLLPLEAFAVHMPSRPGETPGIAMTDGRFFPVRLMEWQPFADVTAAVAEVEVRDASCPDAQRVCHGMYPG